MKRVLISASTEYEVLIERGLTDRCGEFIKSAVNPRTAALITDDNVDALYAESAMKSLENSGIEVVKYVFSHGEAHKSLETIGSILSFLAQNQLTRSDCIVALGGGICGDVAGFCAGIYLRGIKFVQMPTTLLAAVDSSVGGKTGVNLPQGKNLAGVFHQPSLVLCDPDCFKTLLDEIFSDGLAECIKYGIIADSSLFSLFESDDVHENIEKIIERCVIIKGEIVARDEFDVGERQLLNFGHTAGHAIEKASGYSISHGHAVAIGMVIAAKAAEKLGLCADGTAEIIGSVLRQNNLPTSCEFSSGELIEGMLHDKKRNGADISLVLPQEIGRCVLHKTDVSALREIF